ncbi:hypothetical protein ACWCQZ_46180 [Streptomyces sp. NPDC002285]
MAAAHLLQFWLPADAKTGEPLWRVVLDYGRMTDSAVRPLVPWAGMPDLAELGRDGGYPAVFHEAGDAGRRYPVAGRLLEAQADRGGDDDDPVPARFGTELTTWFRLHGVSVSRRARLLIDHLMRQLLEHRCDVVALDVSRAEGGVAVPDEFHFLVRDGGGRMVRLAVAPAGPVDGLPDPACVLAGHSGMQLESGDHSRAVFRTRAAATTALMSDLLPLSNNDWVSFEVATKAHNLDLSHRLVKVDSALRTWWDAPEGRAFIHPDGWEDEEPVPAGDLHLVNYEQLADRFSPLEEEAVRWAGWATDPDFDDQVTLDLPGDHLISWLGRDMVATIADYVAGSKADQPRLTYTTGDHESGTLIVVGPHYIARISFYAAA